MEPDAVGLTMLAIAAVTLAAPVPGLKPTGLALHDLGTVAAACADPTHEQATYYFSLQGQGMISLVPPITSADVPASADCP
jgi:hypothetical protein